jgi:secreted PhoX family phosphatase
MCGRPGSRIIPRESDNLCINDSGNVIVVETSRESRDSTVFNEVWGTVQANDGEGKTVAANVRRFLKRRKRSICIKVEYK